MGCVVHRLATGLVLYHALIFAKLKYFSLFASNPFQEVSCFSKVISPLLHFWYNTCINLAMTRIVSFKLTNFRDMIQLVFNVIQRNVLIVSCNRTEYIILRVLLFCLLRTLPLSHKWGVIQTPSLECCNLKQCRVYT